MPTKSLTDGFVLTDPYIYRYYHQSWFALTVNIYLLRIERKLAEIKYNRKLLTSILSFFLEKTKLTKK
jgi:hypothetical protein